MEPEFSGLVKRLRGVEGIMHGQWQKEENRISLLQCAHDEIAKAYGFKPCEISVQDLGNQNLRGKHAEGKIVINKYLVEKADPEISMRTLAHESRHAYQHYVCQLPVDSISVKRRSKVEEWRKNLQHYKKANILGFEAYFKQPIEVDAREFAEQLICSVYNEGRQ